MLKIGLFTFGGGYAMIAILQREFVERKKWLEENEFLDVVTISESTPGPIAINSATYIGYKIAGTLGSIAATVAVCIPSFTIIYIISLFFDSFLSLALVKKAFMGIQVCVVYLILSAGIKMLIKMKKTLLSFSVFTLSAISLVLLSIFAVNFSTVIYILIGAVIGLVCYAISEIKRKGEGRK